MYDPHVAKFIKALYCIILANEEVLIIILVVVLNGIIRKDRLKSKDIRVKNRFV